MAGSLPTVRSGAAALYPLTRHLEYLTVVQQYTAGNEMRWKKRAPLTRLVLQYIDLLAADKTSIEGFFNSQKGQFDTTWSVTLPAPISATYSNLSFEDDVIRFEERKPRLYSTTLRVRQVQNRAFATPSVSAVFPAIVSGVKSQLPDVRIRKFVTSKNDMASGGRYVWDWYGGGLSGLPTGALMSWELNFPTIQDADVAILEQFFKSNNGRWRTFSFTDPDDASVHTKCRFAGDTFEVKYVGPAHNSVTLVIEEVN